jgi:hypothetical protein
MSHSQHPRFVSAYGAEPPASSGMLPKVPASGSRYECYEWARAPYMKIARLPI